MARPPPRQDPQPGVQLQLFPSHGLSSGESLSSSPCGARVLPAARCWVMSRSPGMLWAVPPALARSCRCRAALCEVQGSLAARARVPCPASAGSPGAADGLGEMGQTQGHAFSLVYAHGWSAPCQGPQLSRVLLTLCLPQQQPLAWVLIAGAGKALIRG